MSNQPHLYVNEIFGPTIQGEGPFMGQHCCFLRLAGCNLSCVWCDTSYTWNFTRTGGTAVRPELKSYSQAEEVHQMTPLEVAEKIFELNTRLVIISGGEPMLQQDTLSIAVGMLIASHKNVQFETNGTVLPDKRMISLFQQYPYNMFWVVSPKLKHAQTLQRPVDIRAWEEYAPSFKFVCQGPEDFDEVEQILGPNHDPSDVFIMAEGRTPEELLPKQRLLIEGTLQRHWNFSTRMHDLLWDNVRAR